MRPLRRALAAAARLLAKAKETGGDPEVEAVAALVLTAYARRWRRVAEDAAEALVEEVQGMADDLPTPDVDALAGEQPRERRRALEAAVAALVLTLERRALAPPPAALASVVREAALRLAENGARRAGLALDPSLPRVARALAAAERDLPLVVGGRAPAHRRELEALAEELLTSRTARTPGGALGAGAAAGLPPLPGAARTLGDVRAGLEQALGAAGGPWLADSIWAWAYRWNSVGAFLAAREARVALYVWNNPPRGPDRRTTPFCRWLHGRQVAVGRAALQVDQYMRAVMTGDLDGMRAAWPLDQEVERGDSGRWALTYARLGLPPYHFGCRDQLLAGRPGEG